MAAKARKKKSVTAGAAVTAGLASSDTRKQGRGAALEKASSGVLQEASSATPKVAETPIVKLPVISDVDLRRDFPWRYFGAHVEKGSTVFRVYAPEADEVLLLREGNAWGRKTEYLYREADGVWHIRVPETLTRQTYKYLIRNRKKYLKQPYEQARIDPFSSQLAVSGPQDAKVYNSIVSDPNQFEWTHKHLNGAAFPDRTGSQRQTEAARGTCMSIYELHLSTFHDANYRNVAEKIVGHLGFLGFTHVQIMPPFQTPLHESWGYLVGCPYAINERYGSVDDFKFLVNRLHQAGIGVIVDVPLGFGVQNWDCGLSEYDGSELYHHAGPRGWNNQWKTRIYNVCSPYVKDYLTGLCAYLHHELGVDGARIDAVAGQIFFDYDRGDWDWPRNDRSKVTSDDWAIFNAIGGDRHFPERGYWLSEATDFDALRFFREFHTRLSRVAPDFVTIAEESRRVFPRLACPVSEGGLGFKYAQNMGEMHRIRTYLKIPTEQRKIEHVEMIIHNNSQERFVNAMNTHDECANGRTRLITELGNHVQLIGLAALCWFRAGAPMIFMGDEFGEEGYFDVTRPLDWSKTGPQAALHQQQITRNFHDLNWHLTHEPALARHEISSMTRNGSNNEHKWFAFVRWGSQAKWESERREDHKDDIIYIRNESPISTSRHAEIYVPVPGEYRVLYNSIDERYIGAQYYNRHDPYWSAHSGGKFLYIELKPYQNIALKLK
ncbi:MAG TPA: alpha-amylase family glycosyl hydrolase [Planctomycetota bacterium]|jgi:1,4-alpha-glucan branching enzyme